MENNEKIGIYQILNTSNGKSYIGQSKNIKNREYQHFSKIKIKKHENKKIMLDINDNFVFNVLKECDYEDLDYYEWFYIKMYNSIKNGYNIQKTTNFKNIDLNEYKIIIEDFKNLINSKNVNIKVDKKFLKKRYTKINFKIFSVLLNKQCFENHNFWYFDGKYFLFELKSERDKLFNSLNY
jgi:group I intron endonuclease